MHNPIKQKNRSIDWENHTTDEIIRRIYAADGNPGILDEIYGQKVYLFNAQKEKGLTGNPGKIIAKSEHAVCRATKDGARWISHLKQKYESGEKGIKLPATVVLKDFIPENIKNIEIDYTKAGKQIPCQDRCCTFQDSAGYQTPRIRRLLPLDCQA